MIKDSGTYYNTKWTLGQCVHCRNYVRTTIVYYIIVVVLMMHTLTQCLLVLNIPHVFRVKMLRVIIVCDSNL